MSVLRYFLLAAWVHYSSSDTPLMAEAIKISNAIRALIHSLTETDNLNKVHMTPSVLMTLPNLNLKKMLEKSTLNDIILDKFPAFNDLPLFTFLLPICSIEGLALHSVDFSKLCVTSTIYVQDRLNSNQQLSLFPHDYLDIAYSSSPRESAFSPPKKTFASSYLSHFFSFYSFTPAIYPRRALINDLFYYLIQQHLLITIARLHPGAQIIKNDSLETIMAFNNPNPQDGNQEIHELLHSICQSHLELEQDIRNMMYSLSMSSRISVDYLSPYTPINYNKCRAVLESSAGDIGGVGLRSSQKKYLAVISTNHNPFFQVYQYFSTIRDSFMKRLDSLSQKIKEDMIRPTERESLYMFEKEEEPVCQRYDNCILPAALWKSLNVPRTIGNVKKQTQYHESVGIRNSNMENESCIKRASNISLEGERKEVRNKGDNFAMENISQPTSNSPLQRKVRAASLARKIVTSETLSGDKELEEELSGDDALAIEDEGSLWEAEADDDDRSDVEELDEEFFSDSDSIILPKKQRRVRKSTVIYSPSNYTNSGNKRKKRKDKLQIPLPSLEIPTNSHIKSSSHIPSHLQDVHASQMPFRTLSHVLEMLMTCGNYMFVVSLSSLWLDKISAQGTSSRRILFPWYARSPIFKQNAFTHHYGTWVRFSTLMLTLLGRRDATEEKKLIEITQKAFLLNQFGGAYNPPTTQEPNSVRIPPLASKGFPFSDITSWSANDSSAFKSKDNQSGETPKLHSAIATPSVDLEPLSSQSYYPKSAPVIDPPSVQYSHPQRPSGGIPYNDAPSSFNPLTQPTQLYSPSAPQITPHHSYHQSGANTAKNYPQFARPKTPAGFSKSPLPLSSNPSLPQPTQQHQNYGIPRPTAFSSILSPAMQHNPPIYSSLPSFPYFVRQKSPRGENYLEETFVYSVYRIMDDFLSFLLKTVHVLRNLEGSIFIYDEVMMELCNLSINIDDLRRKGINAARRTIRRGISNSLAAPKVDFTTFFTSKATCEDSDIVTFVCLRSLSIKLQAIVKKMIGEEIESHFYRVKENRFFPFTDHNYSFVNTMRFVNAFLNRSQSSLLNATPQPELNEGKEEAEALCREKEALQKKNEEELQREKEREKARKENDEWIEIMRKQILLDYPQDHLPKEQEVKDESSFNSEDWIIGDWEPLPETVLNRESSDKNESNDSFLDNNDDLSFPLSTVDLPLPGHLSPSNQVTPLDKNHYVIREEFIENLFKSGKEVTRQKQIDKAKESFLQWEEKEKRNRLLHLQAEEENRRKSIEIAEKAKKESENYEKWLRTWNKKVTPLTTSEQDFKAFYHHNTLIEDRNGSWMHTISSVQSEIDFFDLLNNSSVEVWYRNGLPQTYILVPNSLKEYNKQMPFPIDYLYLINGVARRRLEWYEGAWETIVNSLKREIEKRGPSDTIKNLVKELNSMKAVSDPEEVEWTYSHYIKMKKEHLTIKELQDRANKLITHMMEGLGRIHTASYDLYLLKSGNSHLVKNK